MRNCILGRICGIQIQGKIYHEKFLFLVGGGGVSSVRIKTPPSDLRYLVTFGGGGDYSVQVQSQPREVAFWEGSVVFKSKVKSYHEEFLFLGGGGREVCSVQIKTPPSDLRHLVTLGSKLQDFNNFLSW